MNPEKHIITYNGAPIGVHLTHADALGAICAAGVEPGQIPAGCNTLLQPLTLQNGAHALGICQRGFSPRASDNEEQVNGWTLLVLLDPAWSATDAQAVLASVARSMLELPD